MTTLFYLLATAMMLVALALVVVPLVRQGRLHGRSRGVFVLVVALAVLVPLASAGLYRLVGTPSTLAGVAPPREMGVDEAIAALQDRLNAHPDDVAGWLLLGQTYTMLKQPGQARDAYDHALGTDAHNGAAMVGWAEADSLLRDDHRIVGRGVELLQAAVTDNPQNQKALWLLGIAQFQQERFVEAAATWRSLQPLLDPDSNVAHAVAQQIAQADKRAGTGSAPDSMPAPAPASSR